MAALRQSFMVFPFRCRGPVEIDRRRAPRHVNWRSSEAGEFHLAERPLRVYLPLAAVRYGCPYLARWSCLQTHFMSTSPYDCVSCGACCFSRNPRYLQLLPWDAGRALPPESLVTEDGRTYVRFDCGHCVHLDLSGGKAACKVYEDRPEACRAFRAGSFECAKAIRANGILGEKTRPPAAA